MKKTLIILSILFLVSVVNADQNNIYDNSAKTMNLQAARTPFSLIDLSRVKWSNSYSVSFFSGGNGSGSMGLLNSKVFYEFSPKLSLTLNVGLAHNSGNFWGDASGNATVLPSFQLDYKPSNNFHISIGMQTYQGYWAPGTYVNPYFINK